MKTAMNINKNKNNQHLSLKTMRDIDNFLGAIDGNPLANETLRVNSSVIGTFYHKLQKENGREFQVDTHHYSQNQLKDLL
ncbi:MAG: hypothetical protein Ta2E_11020 [Mycoplasmoidaceae bacterium]|nr:MAG: hypothetical protein Ta2E_11020 [Mycoplasmoidaceae bacterium]